MKKMTRKLTTLILTGVLWMTRVTTKLLTGVDLAEVVKVR